METLLKVIFLLASNFPEIMAELKRIFSKDEVTDADWEDAFARARAHSMDGEIPEPAPAPAKPKRPKKRRK